MAASIQIVTIGLLTYSVYARTADPVADLVAYFNARLGTAAAAVTAATADNRARSLIMAADFIDRVCRFSGEETVNGQARSFPRDGASCDGTAITDGTVPEELPTAEFELAGYLLQDATLYDGEGSGSNVRRVQAGSASVEFFIPTINSAKDRRLPVVVNDILKCLFEGAGDTFLPEASGTDVCNHFDEDDFNRCRGLA